jgi:hypothetical protein
MKIIHIQLDRLFIRSHLRCRRLRRRKERTRSQLRASSSRNQVHTPASRSYLWAGLPTLSVGDRGSPPANVVIVTQSPGPPRVFKSAVRSARRRFCRRSRFTARDRAPPGKTMALVPCAPGVIPRISHDCTVRGRPSLSGAADAQLRSDVREQLAVYGCARALAAVIVADRFAVGGIALNLHRRCSPQLRAAGL